MAKGKTYSEKRSFDATPEPAASFRGDVDPGSARPGETFVIHQHHATRLHFDLRLEMLNGKKPVLVSWAVPKNLPQRPGVASLAVHVEDHPFEYGTFSGAIPKGNYGAGEVRIFDSGTYEVLEQEEGKLTFRLRGGRIQGVWHLFKPSPKKGADPSKDEWLVRLKEQERPTADPLPETLPMMATLIEDPFDDDEWIFEPKWDGIRAIATCTDQTLLLSRNQNDITPTYPELARLHQQLVALDAMVDGEIVAMHEGRPSFEHLQNRINIQDARAIERATKQIPVTYIAFDLLYLDGRSLIREPLEERKRLLEEIVVPTDRVQVSPQVPGEGTSLFQVACERKLEGIVAKKLGTPYRPGKRARDWLKIKTTYEADLIIGGWSRGEGSRSHTFGALLVGAYGDDGLRFAGSVGTGFSEKVLERLMPQLLEAEAAECPFVEGPKGLSTGRFGKPIRDPHWTRPELVCAVEFRELTSAGKLRAPSFKGLQPDKDPAECVFDELVSQGFKQG
ncbi:MAG: non-homologous end-joining DNA ligase [Actinomycetota bacterium]|nr:non-homologous end-joining DNA ligase [Actinomycetota bacterium]